jgi:hypothetical protein
MVFNSFSIAQFSGKNLRPALVPGRLEFRGNPMTRQKNQENVRKKTSNRSDGRKTKSPYHRPQLIVYGGVAELTASKIASGFDHNHKKTGPL